MRHRLSTGYGANLAQTILIIKDAAGDGTPADSIAWANSIGTRDGTTALDIVATSPYVSGSDVVYHLLPTTAGTTFACLVDNGNAAVDVRTGVAVTRVGKR
jgi:hypothetical protein